MIAALKKIYLKMAWEYRALLGAGALSLIPILALSLSGSSEAPAGEREARAAVDTFIPRGFVLVPIEVENYEALDSILGRFGMVDLILPSGPSGRAARPVARNVRLLRAPQNPSHFAILIREEQVEQILRFGSTFGVVIRRPGKDGTEFVTSVKPKRRTIVYEGSEK